MPDNDKQNDWVLSLAKRWKEQAQKEEKTKGPAYAEAMRNCAFEMVLMALRAEEQARLTSQPQEEIAKAKPSHMDEAARQLG